MDFNKSVTIRDGVSFMPCIGHHQTIYRTSSLSYSLSHAKKIKTQTVSCTLMTIEY